MSERVAYDDWSPRTVVDRITVAPGPVSALAALLDTGRDQPAPGDPLPALWHWGALARWPRSSALGVDGHPRRGGFLPPVDLPRRMFAGGSLERHAPLTVGAEVERVADVVSVRPTQGRTGRLVLVGTRTVLREPDDGPVLLTEHQDLVFREAGVAPVGAGVPDRTSPGAPLTRESAGRYVVRTDPTLLMRFSAATANPHRIHYDHPYATGTEGYPGLLVQGPLSVLLLLEALRLEGYAAESLTHRLTAPLYCGQPAVIDLDGADAQSVRATLRTRDDLLVAEVHVSPAP